jgi:hypothetical protein
MDWDLKGVMTGWETLLIPTGDEVIKGAFKIGECGGVIGRGLALSKMFTVATPVCPRLSVTVS